MFLKLSSRKGSKYAKELRSKRKEEIIIEKFENSLDILFSMLWNIIQLKTGVRIGISVSMDLTRETSRLFTERIDKFHQIIDKYRTLLNEQIIENMGKYFNIIVPTGLLSSEEFLKSEIALNILKVFIHYYNRNINSFTYSASTLKQLTDILDFDGDYKDPQIIRNNKFLEALLKLIIVISKPRKDIYDFLS